MRFPFQLTESQKLNYIASTFHNESGWKF